MEIKKIKWRKKGQGKKNIKRKARKMEKGSRAIGVTDRDPMQWYQSISAMIKRANDDNGLVNISYSLNYSGERKFTAGTISEKFEEVLWKYVASEPDEVNQVNESSDSHNSCGYSCGKTIWAVVAMKDGNYCFVDMWDGCLSYGGSGRITISNSLEDLLTMCLTPTQSKAFLQFRPIMKP